MNIKAIVFDVNGTLIDIRTDEGNEDVYRVVSNLLSYQGIRTHRHDLKALYYELMAAQKQNRGERHPEFSAVAIFKEIVARLATDYTRSLPAEKLEQLPLLLAEAYRAASRYQLRLYNGVEDTLKQLSLKYRLAVVSDAQTAYALPELHAVGVSAFFEQIIVSGDHGYRKPDVRLFEEVLARMGIPASEAVYVGNDAYRDIHGAQRAGMKTVLFKSNQGYPEKDGVNAGYIIYQFPELLNAIQFLEQQGPAMSGHS